MVEEANYSLKKYHWKLFALCKCKTFRLFFHSQNFHHLCELDTCKVINEGQRRNNKKLPLIDTTNQIINNNSSFGGGTFVVEMPEGPPSFTVRIPAPVEHMEFIGMTIVEQGCWNISSNKRNQLERDLFSNIDDYTSFTEPSMISIFACMERKSPNWHRNAKPKHINIPRHLNYTRMLESIPATWFNSL